MLNKTLLDDLTLNLIQIISSQIPFSAEIKNELIPNFRLK